MGIARPRRRQPGAVRWSHHHVGDDRLVYPAFPPNDIRSGLGDVVFAAQMVTRTTSNGVPYRAMGNAAMLPEFLLRDGETAAPAAALAPIPDGRILPDLNWRRSRFHELAPNIHPQAAPIDQLLVVHESPIPIQHGHGFGTLDLLLITPSPTASADLGTGTADYADLNALPGFSAFLSVITTFRTPVQRPGSMSGFVQAQITITEDAAALATPGMALEPLVGPPQAMSIDGRPGFDANDIGAEPLIEWLPPVLAGANGYTVTVLHLIDVDGKTGNEAVAFIHTTETSVRMPPGVLVPGESYVLRVTSMLEDGIDLRMTPHQQSQRGARAQALTGVLRAE